jgi:hypothetical protein
MTALIALMHTLLGDHQSPRHARLGISCDAAAVGTARTNARCIRSDRWCTWERWQAMNFSSWHIATRAKSLNLRPVSGRCGRARRAQIRFVSKVLTRYVFVDIMNESPICYGTASVVGESGAAPRAEEERGPRLNCRGGAPGGAAPLRHWGARRRNGAAGRVMVRQGAPLRTRRLPALHIPRLRGSGKKGKGAPGARNSKCPGGVALAASGCLTSESDDLRSVRPIQSAG